MFKKTNHAAPAAVMTGTIPEFRRARPGRRAALLAAITLLPLAACETEQDPNQPRYVMTESGMKLQKPGERRETVFGPSGLNIFGGGNKSSDDGTGVNVNGYLWRAALDTISFMPVTSADPFGGTIITDWHSPSATPNERFKVNVFILGKELRADGVRVTAFRQVRSGGGWRDAKADASVGQKLENAILLRARQLRSAALQR